MTSEESEYRAVSLLAKRDSRFRVTSYVLMGLLFGYTLISLNMLTTEVRHTTTDLIKRATELSERSALSRAQQYRDSKIVAKETIRYNTCIFLVPIDQRTPDVQQRCFDAANLPDGLDRSDFSTLDRVDVTQSAAPSGAAAALESPVVHTQNEKVSSSSPHPAPSPPPVQSNTSQPTSPTPAPRPTPPASSPVIQFFQNAVKAVQRAIFGHVL